MSDQIAAITASQLCGILLTSFCRYSDVIPSQAFSSTSQRSAVLVVSVPDTQCLYAHWFEFCFIQ